MGERIYFIDFRISLISGAGRMESADTWILAKANTSYKLRKLLKDNDNRMEEVLRRTFGLKKEFKDIKIQIIKIKYISDSVE